MEKNLKRKRPIQNRMANISNEYKTHEIERWYYDAIASLLPQLGSPVRNGSAKLHYHNRTTSLNYVLYLLALLFYLSSVPAYQVLA